MGKRPLLVGAAAAVAANNGNNINNNYKKKISQYFSNKLKQYLWIFF